MSLVSVAGSRGCFPINRGSCSPFASPSTSAARAASSDFIYLFIPALLPFPPAGMSAGAGEGSFLGVGVTVNLT